jgi:hypothetical protein
MDPNVFRRSLHGAASLGCGVAASAVTYIACTAGGINLHLILAAGEPGHQLNAALAWWAIAGAGFAGAWMTQVYLIAAARERDLVYRTAQRVLIVLVFAVTAAAGLVSKSADVDGAAHFFAALAASGLGLVCGFCGLRLGYYSSDQA